MKFTLEQVRLRRTSENEKFPWTSRLVTLLRVARDGNVQQAKTDSEKAILLGAAREGELVLAAWPGEWSQDIFVVDDLHAARIAFGVPRNGVEAIEAGKPEADPRNDRYDEPQPRLWSRLADLPELPLVAQRELASRSFGTVEVLLGRSDLDLGIRAQILDNLPFWSASKVTSAGTISAAEVERLLDLHPDSTDLIVAALRRADVREAAEQRLDNLSYDKAARIWIEGDDVRDLVGRLLPVILAKDPMQPRTGYRSDRYERTSLIRSMVGVLSVSERRHWINHPEYAASIRQALLSGADLADEELLTCLHEITRISPVAPGQTPAMIGYIRRYPRLIELAKTELAEAAANLVRAGWSPTQAAQAAQWADLLIVAQIAKDRELIENLVHAAVFDSRSPSIIDRAPWREPLRYELVDQLVAASAVSDAQISYLLERIGLNHLTELHDSAGKRSRLKRLTSAAITTRLPQGSSSPTRPTVAQHLPTDDELAQVDDKAAALLQLWRDRPSMTRREDVAAHIIASRYATEDLVWGLPIVDIEQHPIWGARLASRLTELCGDSPARWQELSRSFGQPTQLLARTLFSRLENAQD